LASEIDALQTRLEEALASVKEAVDLSVKIRLADPNAWKEVSGLWNLFLGEFWQYIKVQSVRSGQNLLRGISIRFR
jgi:hypothetical protein